ncbi:ammonium transporter [Oceanicaulis alexandrii]|uniref:ammonium transporter n=1 Tax=Oceanicaulis alexandrii TaxID=153233 RepID=UPI0035D05D3D
MDQVQFSGGDVAWILTACALVLMMTLPGLALFYGGMVRRQNVLSTLMQSLGAAMVVSLVWVIAGYSFAFSGDGALFGGFDKVFLNGLTLDSEAAGLPEAVFILFQMTFAIITVAIIAGGAAERLSFKAWMVFAPIWLLVVYAPIAHWVWGEGFLYDAGVLDFAGGAVVHINAGVAGLVLALKLGPRRGWPKEGQPPHNLVLTVIGAGLLWVGWFGFNGGSALGANALAAHAALVTQIAAAAAALTWALMEWILRGKPSVLGAASGAIAGLVGITPAAGFVEPYAAFLIGVLTAGVAYWGVTGLKKLGKYDDSLDAFGLHGVGGLAGAILTGVFASSAIGGTPGAVEGNVMLVFTQTWGALAAAAWCGIATFVILWLMERVMKLRVEEEDEVTGLDVALHGESA